MVEGQKTAILALVPALEQQEACGRGVAVCHLQHPSHHIDVVQHNPQRNVQVRQLQGALLVVLLILVLEAGQVHLADVNLGLGVQDHAAEAGRRGIRGGDVLPACLHQAALLQEELFAPRHLKLILCLHLVQHIVEHGLGAVQAPVAGLLPGLGLGQAPGGVRAELGAAGDVDAKHFLQSLDGLRRCLGVLLHDVEGRVH
mmetsp:Transcript_28845/g.82945  ORF Transcript_28845/g.82945 Transcript_28845/m.82945 type:complete len:200 (+) Transcript_28845:275-874(+)